MSKSKKIVTPEEAAKARKILAAYTAQKTKEFGSKAGSAISSGAKKAGSSIAKHSKSGAKKAGGWLEKVLTSK